MTVFLNQNVSHYISFLTNKRCFFFIKSNQFRSTNSRNMISDSYIGYDKFLPEQFILYKRIVKVDLFAMYCLLRLQLPNRSQLMQQYMNHKTHPEMMSSTLVMHPPALSTRHYYKERRLRFHLFRSLLTLRFNEWSINTDHVTHSKKTHFRFLRKKSQKSTAKY